MRKIVTFEVVGPRAGQSFKFRHYEFLKGKISFDVDEEQLKLISTFMARTQQAYPLGSPALVAAKAAFGVVEDGKLQAQEDSGGRPPAEVLGAGEAIPERPADPDPVDGSGPNDAAARRARLFPPGSGANPSQRGGVKKAAPAAQEK